MNFKRIKIKEMIVNYNGLNKIGQTDVLQSNKQKKVLQVRINI